MRWDPLKDIKRLCDEADKFNNERPDGIDNNGWAVLETVCPKLDLKKEFAAMRDHGETSSSFVYAHPTKRNAQISCLTRLCLLAEAGQGGAPFLLAKGHNPDNTERSFPAIVIVGTRAFGIFEHQLHEFVRTIRMAEAGGDLSAKGMRATEKAYGALALQLESLAIHGAIAPFARKVTYSIPSREEIEETREYTSRAPGVKSIEVVGSEIDEAGYAPVSAIYSDHPVMQLHFIWSAFEWFSFKEREPHKQKEINFLLGLHYTEGAGLSMVMRLDDTVLSMPVESAVEAYETLSASLEHSGGPPGQYRHVAHHIASFHRSMGELCERAAEAGDMPMDELRECGGTVH